MGWPVTCIQQCMVTQRQGHWSSVGLGVRKMLNSREKLKKVDDKGRQLMRAKDGVKYFEEDTGG